MIKDITLLKDLTALSAVGGNPFDYFEDIGIGEVAIYGNDDLLPIVWTYGFWSNVKVKHVLADAEQTFKINVGEATRSSLLHCSKVDEFNENLPVVTLEKASADLKKAISLKNLITYSRKKRMLLDKVLQYKLDNPGVRVMILDLPSVAYERNKSEYEERLRACSANIIIEQEKVIKYLSEHIGDKDYGQIILKEAVFGTTRKEGVYFLADKHSKYVNVNDGYRVIPNAPQKYTHTVYTFGNSLCMGMYTDDEHTIQYQLQKRLNELQNAETYRVVNAANGGHPNFNKMWKSIEYHKPKAGDIIVLISWFDSIIKKNPNYLKHFEFCCPQQEMRLFDRPHNYGDYVWVDRVHLNCKSYTKLGDCLADRVIAMCEESTQSNDHFVYSDSNVVFPDSEKLQRNKFWMFQHFKHTDYLEYIRKSPLNEATGRTGRWLNFEINKPLFVGRNYKIIILMKYEEDAKFRFFLHGLGKIDYLPEKSVEADKWTAVEYDYTPSHQNVHVLSFSATNFISAGTKLCIKKISITEENS